MDLSETFGNSIEILSPRTVHIMAGFQSVWVRRNIQKTLGKKFLLLPRLPKHQIPVSVFSVLWKSGNKSLFSSLCQKQTLIHSFKSYFFIIWTWLEYEIVFMSLPSLVLFCSKLYFFFTKWTLIFHATMWHFLHLPFLAPLILRLQSKNVFHGNRMFALWVWLLGTDNGHTKAKSLILCGPKSNPNPKNIFRCTEMGADKLAENISARIVCPSPKDWDFNEKRLHWASVVRAYNHGV